MPLTDPPFWKAKSAEKAKKLFDGGGLYLEVAPNEGKDGINMPEMPELR